MIEKLILDYLNSEGVTAFMEIPEGGGTPPFAIVQKTGGGEENQLRHATIAIQSYGSSMYDAASLNETVISAMKGLPARPEVASCRLNSDYNYTDTTKMQYRYQAVFDVVYYSA